MNLATCLSAPPARLGSPDAENDAAWTAYFTQLRESLMSSNNAMVRSYDTLRRVREAFGKPLVSTNTAEGDQSGLSLEQNQRIHDLAATNSLLIGFMDDVLEGKRQLFYEDGDFSIEAFDDDPLTLENRNGTLVAVDREGNVVPATVGIAPIVWGGIVAGTVVAAVVGYYFVNESNNQRARIETEEKTKRAIAEQQETLVKGGHATPEQAKAMTDAIYVGAAELEQARAAGEAKDASSEVQGTIKTVAWVGLGIAGLYVLAKTIPMLSSVGSPART